MDLPRRSIPVVGALALLLSLTLLPPVAMSAVSMSAVSMSAVSTNAVSQSTGRQPCRAGWVALTFDDGPDARVTRRLVRILVQARVPATFFMVGERVAQAPAAARLVSRSGFQIANHSYWHANMTTQSSAQIVRTLRSTQRELRRAGAEPTTLMRPPYGAINPRVARAIRHAGYQPVLWDADSWDWSGGNVETIARRVLGSMESRANIVLQHDGILNSPNSIAAVPRIVRRARAKGYCFTELDDQGRLVAPMTDARKPPAIAVDPASVREPERGNVDASIRVRLGRTSGTEVRLTLLLEPGTAGARDVRATRLEVTIPPGRLATIVAVPVRADRQREADERLVVRIVDVENAWVFRDRTTLLIHEALADQ